MRYELWLSLRYLFAKRRERFVSVIALLSIGGVALGVASLIVVLAVMSGFDSDIKEKLVSANAHVIVQAPGGITETESVELIRRFASAQHVVGVTPFLMGQAILRLPDRAFGVEVRGLDAERESRVSKLADNLVMGHLPRRDDEILIGNQLSQVIGAGLGDSLVLISPADGRLYEFTISGVFHTGMFAYDASLVGVTLSRAQQLFEVPGMVGGLGLRLDAVERSTETQQTLQAQLGPDYEVKTWMELNPVLFRALRLEKLVMFIILTLIIVVAALNIVSMLIMIVMEKTKDIGILRTLGATRASVARLFLWQGGVVGFLGTCLGLAGGLALTQNLNRLAGWLERTVGFSVFPSTIYYLDEIPTQINAADLSLIVGATFILALLAGTYPAWRASRLVPVEALRYE